MRAIGALLEVDMASPDLASCANLFRTNAKSVLFVTSQLRPRELKMADGLRRLGWKVGLIYSKWTPFDPKAYFDFCIEAGSAEEAHSFAMQLAPRVTHVFSGAIDDWVLLLCRHKPSPVVIDLNDVFAPSLFDYCHERFALTQEALALADGFCARDLQVKSAERVDKFKLPPNVLLFPEYCWNAFSNLRKTPELVQPDEVRVVSVGTFSLETQGMYDSCYLQLTKLLIEQQIHFHIYPHWAYRRGHSGSPHANFERDFADFIALEKTSPYLHLHDSLPIEELAKVLPQYDFGIVSGGCAEFGQKLGFYYPAYLETCYSGRISDYLEARLPVLINDEVKFDYWLLKRHGAGVDLKGVLRPGFKQTLLDLNRDRRQPEVMERAAHKLSVEFNIPRLASFYEGIIDPEIRQKAKVAARFRGAEASVTEDGSAGLIALNNAALQSFETRRAPLIDMLRKRIRWASPRVAKILLPYRAIRLFEVRLHNTLQENQSTHVSIATLRSQVADLEQDKAALQAKVTSLEQIELSLGQDQANFHSQVVSLEQDKVALYAKVAALEQSELDLGQDGAVLQSQVASLEHDKAALHAKIASFEQVELSLGQDKAVLQVQVTSLEQLNVVIHAKLARLEQDKAALHTRVANLAQGKMALHAQVASLEQGKVALVNKLSSLEQSKAALEHGKAALLAKATSLEKDKHSARVQITGLEDDKKTLRAQILGLEKDKESFRAQLVGLEQDKDVLRGRVVSLDGDKENLHAQMAGLERDKTLQRARIIGLEKDKAVMQSQLTNLEQDKSVVLAQVTTLEQDKSAMQSQLSSLEQEKASVLAQVATLEQDKAVMQSQLTNLEQDKSVVLAQVITLEQDKSAMQSQLSSLEQEKASVLAQVATLEQDKAVMQSQLTNLEQDKFVVLAQVTTLEQDKSAMQSQLSSLEQEKASVLAQVATLEQDKAVMQSQLTNLEQDKSVVLAQVTTLEQDKSVMQLQLTSLEQEKASVLAQVATLEQDKAVMQSQLTNLEQDKSVVLAQVTTLEQDKSAMQSQLANLEQDKSVVLAQVTTLEQDKSVMQLQLTSLEQEKASVLAQVATLEQDKSAMQSQLSSLEQEKATVQGLVAGLEQDKAVYRIHIAGLEQQKNVLCSQVAILEQEKNGLQSHVASLEHDKIAYRAQIAGLEQGNTELRSQSESLLVNLRSYTERTEREQLVPAANQMSAKLNQAVHTAEKDLKPIDEAPKLLLACMPKSGSTWLTSVLEDKLALPPKRCYLESDRNEQELDTTVLFQSWGQRVLFVQQHIRYSRILLQICRAFSTKIVVLTRRLDDIVVSLRDHIEKESPEFSMSYMESDWFQNKSPAQQIDFIIDHVMPWYFNFFVGWQRAAQSHGDVILQVHYEEMIKDPKRCVENIASFYGTPVQGLILSNSDKRAGTRFNQGRVGRGMEELSDKQQARLRKLASYYPDCDFEAVGLKSKRISSSS